ncbi:uncharacterized protein LOC125896888 isoform X3 [Epinephelus fuscoguttatus]|uniref:uncharacterized protein LOC125896888 isoform X3 n=1 Tax=Epinephelus fuscoguttatus TaxID=293821 RepID=UPI0020D0D483|nr:uncharacterized protein LOC125896888 isoform X3 [Epinephelus fuscoguttatus]
MGEFRWINKTLFLILVLQFTAETGQTRLSFTVRAGDDVTLPCGNVINSHDKCRGTSWLSSGSLGKTAEELISHGQISNSVIGKAKSSRLSVTADCSLVIKKVTHDDVGRYSCRQFRSGRQVSDSQVDLSVINSWWRYIIVSVVLATLIISVVTVNIWKRTKGSHTKMEGDAVHHDEDEGPVTYENIGEPSASIRLH